MKPKDIRELSKLFIPVESEEWGKESWRDKAYQLRDVIIGMMLSGRATQKELKTILEKLEEVKDDN